MSETVLIVGASPKPERYAHKAMLMLEEYGHRVILVNPRGGGIDGRKVFASLDDVLDSVGISIDTVTMYVGSSTNGQFRDGLIRLNPQRVIFNPDTENPELEAALVGAGIQVDHACTLVLLRTDQFDQIT